MSDVRSSVVVLLEGLKRQQECVRQLTSLCDDQRRLVADGDAEGLLRLLGRRQGLIRELEEAEKDVSTFKTDWPASRDTLPVSERPAIEQMLVEIEEALKRIIDQDESDYKQLAETKDAVGAEIRRTATGRQVNAAYGAQRAKPSLLTDGGSA